MVYGIYIHIIYSYTWELSLLLTMWISICWLVVTGTLFLFSHSVGNNHFNWLSYFSEGFKPPTSVSFDGIAIPKYRYTYIYIYSYICSLINPLIHELIDWFVMLYWFIYTYVVYTFTCTYVYIYIYIYTYVYVCICMYEYRSSCGGIHHPPSGFFSMDFTARFFSTTSCDPGGCAWDYQSFWVPWVSNIIYNIYIF